MTPEQKRAYWKQYLKAMRSTDEPWPQLPDGMDGIDMYIRNAMSMEEYESINRELEAEHASVS